MSVSGTSFRTGEESPGVPAWGISCAVVLTRRPEWEYEIGGLSVLERLVHALERRGVPSVRLVAAAEDVEWDAVRGRTSEDGGAILVFTAPVLLDRDAVAFLQALPVRAGEPVRLTHGSAAPPQAAAFLMAADDLVSVREILAESKPGAAGTARFHAHWQDRTVDRGLFHPLKGRKSVGTARSALRSSLTKPTDGFFASWIDRRLSTRISLVLARAGVTPNQVTLVALVPALAGAALLAIPNPAWSAGGALLFWASTVLDGCDGEVARLTYRESAGGARLDLLCDNVALVAVFLGILIHVFLEDGGRTVLLLGAAILTGMVGCMVTEYVRILRPRIVSESGLRAASGDAAPRAARVLWYERLASRDFAYLLPFLAWFGWLRYLVWATAVGVNVFWVVLATFVARRRREVSR